MISIGHLFCCVSMPLGLLPGSWLCVSVRMSLCVYLPACPPAYLLVVVLRLTRPVFKEYINENAATWLDTAATPDPIDNYVEHAVQHVSRTAAYEFARCSSFCLYICLRTQLQLHCCLLRSQLLPSYQCHTHCQYVHRLCPACVALGCDGYVGACLVQ